MFDILTRLNYVGNFKDFILVTLIIHQLIRIKDLLYSFTNDY